MVLSGCQPSAGSVITALKDNAPSFLPGPACCSLSIASAQTWSPSHSKALQSPSVGSVLWSTFAEEKVIGKEGGRESSWKTAQHLSGNRNSVFIVKILCIKVMETSLEVVS